MDAIEAIFNALCKRGSNRWIVTVHLTPKQLWLIDSGRVFTGFPGCFGLPSNGICDSLRA
jgi:hypothetical protein